MPFRTQFSEQETAAILAGATPALGFEWRWREDPTVWREAPDTGRLWPHSFFGRIAHRPGNPHGDARVVWEPSRLQHLVTLALFARAHPSLAVEAVRLIEKQFVSWTEANPPLTGIHFVSAMECALRIVAVCHALDLVRDRLSRASPVWHLLPHFIWMHARLIERRLSLFSSRGNHTIAECVGLLYAGYLFPEFAKAQRWRRIALPLIVEEASRQILEDGGGIEQATWYHLFIVDLCGLALRLLELKGETPPKALSDAVARARVFLAAFAGDRRTLPDIGDRDDGYALSPYLDIGWASEELVSRVQVFERSGYTKVALAGAPGTHLILDHGPLGMAPGYGHGHADALSLLFFRSGEPILADTGTYGYGLDASWRRYFRGTSAHNTVTIDGADQAMQETAFQWSQPYSARLVKLEEDGADCVLVLACHDGYARHGIVHWRGVFVARSIGFTVFDIVNGKGLHSITAHWHCNSSVRRADGANRFLLHGQMGIISVEAESAEAVALEGVCEPAAGWTAPRYSVKEPMPTIRLQRETILPHTLITRVRSDAAFALIAGERDALERVRTVIANG